MAPIRVLVAGGTGDVGQNIVKALAEDTDYQVTVLTRPGTTSDRLDTLRQWPVELVSADYTDHAGLVQALQGIDTVVSAIGFEHLHEPQLALLRAAQAAGVRRFVPSEFALDVAATPAIANAAATELTAANLAIQQAIGESGLEYTYYYNGYFYHYMTEPVFNVDVAAGTASVVGHGDTLASFTDVRDVGRFVAVSLKQPYSRNASLRIEGAGITINDLLARIQQHTGRKLDITHIPVETVEQAIDQDGALTHFANAFLLQVEHGNALLHSPKNSAEPDFKFTSIDDYIKSTYCK